MTNHPHTARCEEGGHCHLQGHDGDDRQPSAGTASPSARSGSSQRFISWAMNAEFLVLVGALGGGTGARCAGHHRHVLYGSSDRLPRTPGSRAGGWSSAIDDAGAELFGLFVFDGDPGVVGGGGHAGHDEATTLVVRRCTASPRTGGRRRRYRAPGASRSRGMSRPRDRQACRRLSAPSTSSVLPSTWIVAMVQVFVGPLSAGVANRNSRFRRACGRAAARRRNIAGRLAVRLQASGADRCRAARPKAGGRCPPGIRHGNT